MLRRVSKVTDSSEYFNSNRKHQEKDTTKLPKHSAVEKMDKPWKKQEYYESLAGEKAVHLYRGGYATEDRS